MLFINLDFILNVQDNDFVIVCCIRSKRAIIVTGKGLM